MLCGTEPLFRINPYFAKDPKMKMSLVSALILSAFSALAQPIAPLDYQASQHSKTEIRKMYNSLYSEELKGEDCFKRAYIWSYQLVQNFNARPIKVFFHYTDKFNFELDSQGVEGGLARMFNGGSKIVWDFHVAPAVEDEQGNVIVFDPKVFPGKGPMTLTQWIDGLADRGEFFLKKRKDKLYDDLESVTNKLERKRKRLRKLIERELDTSFVRADIKELEKEEDEIKATMDRLGIISKRKTKKITCSEITNIEEFDQNQWGAWCFYQKTSMYYFATGELRVLNYGTLGNHQRGQLSTQGEINALINDKFRGPVNPDYNPELFENGASIYSQSNYDDGANYQATQFTDYYLELALSEVKSSHRPDLEFFKTYLKLKDPDFERELERQRKEEEERQEELRKEEERRQNELERERRREERRQRRERRRNRD